MKFEMFLSLLMRGCRKSRDPKLTCSILNENFYMLENERIDEMLTRFTKITNALSSLGDKIDNDQKI